MAEVSNEIKQLTETIKNLLQLQATQLQQNIVGNKSSSSQTEFFNQLSNRLHKYQYNTGKGPKPFKKWLNSHEYTITTEAASLPEEMKTRLIWGSWAKPNSTA